MHGAEVPQESIESLQQPVIGKPPATTIPGMRMRVLDVPGRGGAARVRSLCTKLFIIIMCLDGGCKVDCLGELGEEE